MGDQSGNNQNKTENLNWLQRLLQQLSRGKRGDIVAANIGENATGVAVGKNIIQIGTLKIPIWVLVVVAAGIVVGVSIVLYDALNTTNELGKIGSVVLATPTPTAKPHMADGQFNIAVAEFYALDKDGQPTRNQDALELSQSIAKFLDNQQDALTEVIGEQVVIWGPDKGISPVAIGQEDAQARILNAKVLLYGNLRAIDDDHWQVEPRFYLTDNAVGQAYELHGEHALGSKISYRPQNIASKGDVNKTLRLRLDALSQLLIGLSYMVYGDIEGYQHAAETFHNLAEATEWGKGAGGTQNSGQEILYLFLGNASLGQSFLISDNDPARIALLIDSRKAFTTAISLNANYARPYNGLGSTLFQMARALETADLCAWNWDLLDEAAQAYTKAIELPPEAKPASGQVDFRANFGLGRVHYWEGICPDPAKGDLQATWQAEWGIARDHYQFVLDEYAQMPSPNPHVTDIAAYAHTDLGYMALKRADSLLPKNDATQVEQGKKFLIESIEHYARSLELTKLSKTADGVKHAKETMPFYLTALCLDHQGERAQAALADFIAKLSDAESVRTMIIQQTPLWEECTNAQSK